MSICELISNSTEATRLIGYQLAPYLEGGDIVALIGPLGAGKSTIVSAIVKALHKRDYSSSPTYTLIHNYDLAEPKIYHIDLFRVEDQKGIAELGLDDYLYGNGISLIEWFQNLASEQPKEYLEIAIKCNIDSSRSIQISGKGNRGREILEKIKRDSSLCSE